MVEAPFMLSEYEQQLAQLYLNYEQAVFDLPYNHEQVKAQFEAWRALLFHPTLGQKTATDGT